MFDSSFWRVSGIVLWGLVLLYGIVRLIYGKRWPIKLGSSLFLGSGLKAASKRLVGEFKQGKVKDETITEVGVHVFWRLTRIGVIGLAIAAIPILLLVQQNKLLNIQNEKVDIQNALVEGQRRSSLVLLMSNVLTDLSKEIDEQKQGLSVDSLAVLDSLGYSLSTPLIGRISSLVQGFQPYQILVNGQLSEKEYSPERAQLFLALIGSNLIPSTGWYGKISTRAAVQLSRRKT